MKIAGMSQNLRTVTGHAGRARRFLIYDIDPTLNAEPAEIAGLDLPKELALPECQDDGPHPLDGVVVLSGSFGEGFARRVARRGIVAGVTAEADPRGAVKAFVADAVSAAMAGVSGGCEHQHGHRHAHGNRVAGRHPAFPVSDRGDSERPVKERNHG